MKFLAGVLLLALAACAGNTYQSDSSAPKGHLVAVNCQQMGTINRLNRDGAQQLEALLAATPPDDPKHDSLESQYGEYLEVMQKQERQYQRYCDQGPDSVGYSRSHDSGISRHVNRVGSEQN